MKIAILTSGILPIPAVQGGAVENLIDFYLEYNDIHKLHDITIYSVFNEAVNSHQALESDVNHYEYVNVSSFTVRARRKIRSYFHKDEYYNYMIEYFFEQAYKKLKREKYDIILLENRPGYVVKLSSRTNSKIILHLHNDLLNSTTPYSKKIYESIDKIITVSSYIANRANTCDKEEKCLVVHNGIDLDNFSKEGNGRITRISLGLDNNDFILVFSGRIIPEKGISELIDAMIKIKSYRNIKLLIIGGSFFGNDLNDNEFMASIKSKAKEIKDNITFTGFIPYTEMPDYLRLCDVAIIPSIWDDPFPTTVLEAQAMSLPIIATKKGGIPEEVNDNDAILINVDSEIINKLAESILYLYNNEEIRKEMSAESYKKSREFSKEMFAKNFFDKLN